jgi:hypothetical protein
MLARLCLLAAIAPLAACAAALPGYTPPPFKEPNKFALPMESGEIGPDGRYVMSGTEKAMDCKRLTGSMLITIARLKDAQSRNVGSQFAASTQRAVHELGGGSSVGADREGDFARERAKLAAYNAELAQRNCKTVDIDAEMARPPEGLQKY